MTSEQLAAMEALETALEALINLCNNSSLYCTADEVIAAEAALERVYKSRAIEQAKRQQALDKMAENERELGIQMQPEPVAWMYESVCGNDFATRLEPPNYAKNIRPLYTTPPAAPVQQDQFADSRNMVAAPVQEPVAWAVHYKGPIPLFTKTKSEAEAWGGNKIVPLYTTPPAVPVQEPVACQHKRYSVDVHEQTGTCYDCGAEGRMRFVVGDATSPTAPVQEK